MFNCLLEIYNEKIKRMKDVKGKVADFVQTEVSILIHWLAILPPLIKVLELKTWKKAVKQLNKLKPNDYINKVVRPLVKKKSAYKSM